MSGGNDGHDGNSAQGPKAFGDSDREWFAALSGQVPAGDAGAATKEGLALRLALEQRRRELEPDAHADAALDDQAIERMHQKLLQRARDEGLFAPPTAKVITFPWWRRGRPLLALAASVLLAVVLSYPYLLGPDYSEPPMTAGSNVPLLVRAAGPRAGAERLHAALQQAGLRPGIYQRGRVYVVDVQLLDSERAAAQASFAAVGLTPATGFNRVEFQAP